MLTWITPPALARTEADQKEITQAPMLQSTTLPAGGTYTTTITYEYDPLYRLTNAIYSTGETYIYTMDAVGNRLTLQTGVYTSTYLYDDANRLTYVNGITYTWDANGNLLSDGISTYTYTLANRLAAVGSPSSVAEYSYNGLGDRVSQAVDGNTTNYSIDIAAGLTQVLADNEYTYLYGMSRIGQQITTTEYFLGDALGSVRQLADEEGQVVLAQSYEPYGEVLGSSGETATSYGFDGEWTDTSGLVFLRARYLDPTTGRFTQKDPSRFEPNLYLYASDDPINRVDPSGYFDMQACVVELGDTVWGIADLYVDGDEISGLVNRIIDENGLAHYGQGRSLTALIYPTQSLVVPGYCRPKLAGPRHTDGTQNGYIEGTSTSAVGVFAVLEANGREVVYDFMTLERAEFTFKGDRFLLGLFCGLSTSLVGLGKSWYFGTFNFPQGSKLERDYGGKSMSLTAGIGTGRNPLVGPGGSFDVSVEGTYFVSTGGDPILGVPTVQDSSLWGVTVTPLSEGFTFGRLPVGITQMVLNYSIVRTSIENYNSFEEMATDIESGVHSKALGIPAESVLFSLARIGFANRLRQMYAP